MKKTDIKKLREKIKQPIIWYVCNKCGEFFTPEDYKRNKICEDCKEGTLIKKCGYCGQEFSNCKCEWTEEELKL